MVRTAKEIYAGLSDFELIEIIYMSKSHLALLCTILVSFFFGYMAVAHFSGRVLSRLQAAALTLLYSLIVSVVLLNMYFESSIGDRLVAAIFNVEPNYLGTYMVMSLFIVSWMATVFYMVQVRKSQT